MTKLVQYIGDADEKTISSAELAGHGITSPDLVFSKTQDDDYFRSVPDVVAMFLLSQGDFRAYDGSTILDIFENNASPEAEPEVLSVQIGEDGDPMSGSVVLPAGGSASTHALRKIGDGSDEAMAGDDPVRLQALRSTLFSGEGREVIVAGADGGITVVQLPAGTILASTDDGMVALTFGELQMLIETGGFSLSLSDLSDTDMTSAANGYVMTFVANNPSAPEDGGIVALRPIPTLPGGTVGPERIGSVTVEITENDDFGSVYDLATNTMTAAFAAALPEYEPEGSNNVLMDLPNPEFGTAFFVTFYGEGEDPGPAMDYSINFFSSEAGDTTTTQAHITFDGLDPGSTDMGLWVYPARTDEDEPTYKFMRFWTDVYSGGGPVYVVDGDERVPPPLPRSSGDIIVGRLLRTTEEGLEWAEAEIRHLRSRSY